MSKLKPGMSRRDFVGVSIGAVVIAGVGCGSSDNKQAGTGGQAGVGGNSTGGAGSSTGGAGSSAGGAGTGGAGSSAGGAGTGGAGSSAGGAGTGGAGSSAGGAGTGGAGAGGAATGGAGAGGANTGAGGAATGGKSSGAGGAATGGKSAGTGGAATGGTSAAKGGASATGGSAAAGGNVATGGTSSASTGGTPLVSLVRGTDWVQATLDAIALVGGLPDLTGKTVMLRPNVIDSTTDATTSAEVIHGVLKAVKAKGATTIIVAEDGWNTSSGGGTLGCMEKLGITAVCTAEGATTMDLGAQPHPTQNGIDYSDPVFKADYVIAIPKCKRHTAVGNFTMALKLWYGNTKNNRSHSDATMPGKLHAIKKADFTVIDATACMTVRGPTGGTMVQSKVVVASKDAIAADVTGLLVLKNSGDTIVSGWDEAWKNTQIAGALAQKIPGYLAAKPSAQSQQQFPYVAQGIDGAAIMGY